MLSVMKTKERRLARELRAREGLSIKAIAGRLGVSQASVSLWVRDIQLTSEQANTMMTSAYSRQAEARERLIARRRQDRMTYQEHGRELARQGDPFHAAGCKLYWSERDKSRNQARISNSDPELLRMFIGFLRRYFDIADDDIRVSCNLFADHADRQAEIEQFWLDQLGLSQRSLRKSVVNVYSLSSKRKRVNMLPYGTCRLCVSRTSVTQSIFGAIQEYGGFERAEWLD
jgi:predicted transcriptional regulator